MAGSDISLVSHLHVGFELLVQNWIVDVFDLHVVDQMGNVFDRHRVVGTVVQLVDDKLHAAVLLFKLVVEPEGVLCAPTLFVYIC